VPARGVAQGLVRGRLLADRVACSLVPASAQNIPKLSAIADVERHRESKRMEKMAEFCYAPTKLPQVRGRTMPAVPVTGDFKSPIMKVRRPPRYARHLTAVAALFLGLAEIPIARADSALCLVKVSSYVTELDQLLSKERNWITPYLDLNERYFPLRDCEADALLDVVRGSNFIRSISYASRVNEYYIHFSNEEVSVSFGYQVSEKKSNFASPAWIHK
jgi:hypothetical protein